MPLSQGSTSRLSSIFLNQTIDHIVVDDSARVWRMSRLTRDGTVEPVSRDQMPRREQRQGNMHLPCLVANEQDWQPCPVDPYSVIHDR